MPGQTFGVSAPHVMPFAHVDGQSRTPPQPLPILPQYCCVPAALLQLTWVAQCVAPQTPAMPPPPQGSPVGHAGQSSAPPQPSPMTPQNVLPPSSHVIGRQLGGTQTPLRHSSSSDEHAPQSSERPQPSPIVPQKLAPAALHAPGMQLGPPTQTCSSQVQSPKQRPQSIEPPHASPIWPQ